MTAISAAFDSGRKLRSSVSRAGNVSHRTGPLIILRHGETDGTPSGRYAANSEVGLTASGRRQAASLLPILQCVLQGQRAVVVSSPSRPAIQTAALALPGYRVNVDPLVAEYDYGEFEGLTGQQIRRLAPGWDIWRDGCPDGDSTADVGRRADEFLHARHRNDQGPVVVITHGHFSRILVARALGLAPEYGRLFVVATAAVSLIEDPAGDPCARRWNAAAALLADTAAARNQPARSSPDLTVAAAGPWR
jgi:broad specificity phosphatase PhoE